MFKWGIAKKGVQMSDEQVHRARSESLKSTTAGTTLCVVSVVFMLIQILNFPAVFASALNGVLGIYTIALSALLFWLGFGLSLKISRRFQINKKYILPAVLMIFAVFTSVHLAFTNAHLGGSFGSYLSYAYNNLTPGGIVFSLPAYALYSVFFLEGSFILLATVFVVSAAMVAGHIVVAAGEAKVVNRVTSDFEIEQPIIPSTTEAPRSNTRKLHDTVEAKYQEILERQSSRKHKKLKSELGITAPPPVENNSAFYDEPVSIYDIQAQESAIDEITRMSTEAAAKLNQGFAQATSPVYAYGPSSPTPTHAAASALSIPDFAPHGASASVASGLKSQATAQPYTQNSFGQQTAGYAQPQATFNQWISPSAPQPSFVPPSASSASAGVPDQASWADNMFARQDRNRQIAPNARGTVTLDTNAIEQTKMNVGPAAKPKIFKPKRYIKPTIDLIRTESTNLDVFRAEAIEKQNLLNSKFKEFGVNARASSFTVAPAVTRFEIQLASGTRVASVEQMAKDLAYVLGSSQLRIESTIEGKNAIGLEVPNRSVGTVSIKDILTSREFATHKSPLAVAIGKNLNDEPIVGDICTFPHLLMAGSTGSGKSVCLNTILTSLVFRAHPDEVKLLLVDMKRVELNMYNEIPHMLIPRAIKEVNQVINALKWLQTEMTRRYDILESTGLNNIAHYHALPGYQKGTLERMPYILMVIDEAADLIAKGKKEVEDSIKSLSALARACGIHIILATQRPSVDVITSVIKTNFPVRIAFKVGSRGDSITIINDSGAEKLVGRGDMLYVKESSASRVQGAFIEPEETRRVMNFIRENNECEFDQEIENIIQNGPPDNNNAANGFGDADGIRDTRAQDPMFVPVLKWLVRDDNFSHTASISGLQRQFGVGFARAGKIIDQLAAAGYVSSANGTKTRTVIISREEVENLYGYD